jgi:two-component system sensor histidine kinase RegB
LDRQLRTVCVESELKSILTGLVKNSEDALGDVGSRIVLSVRKESGHVCFSVEDDGIGMSSATVRRACDPFFTTKEPGQGLGLGLFLARTYAENAGGTLQLWSEPGKGTRAELWLPALQHGKVNA